MSNIDFPPTNSSSSPAKPVPSSAQSGTPTGPQQFLSSRQASSQQIPTTSLRVPSNRKTIYDRNLNRSRNAELSRASFAYLFMETVTYAQKRVTGIQDLERRSVRTSPSCMCRIHLLNQAQAERASTPSRTSSPRPSALPRLTDLHTSIASSPHLTSTPPNTRPTMAASLLPTR